ncbi:invasion associated locus B family protein [Lentibacter sp. XHP0401]|jgi:invasion protein IalB|uniref:invasion associated locus B family protein n=1 Tax=Lentibacter sp. XHP0401 TaxID=2984334 RepID=UPI0021E87EFC|nr:invasion associated locus B family protein [Lentibacter sp. XHP0401]MCV2892382.1 invasion associated locus B family protein [Lentibacter sp. XHP0401]
MHTTYRTALILALLAAPFSLSAQTATEEAPAETAEPVQEAVETTDPAAEPAPDELSLGEEAIPEPYIKTEFGDWKLQCLRDPNTPEGEDDANEPCQLFQVLQDDQGTNVAEITIFPLADGGKAVAGANILVPLETLLSAQLTIQIDNGKARRYPYSFCSPIGCFARVGFTGEDIASMKKGAKAKVLLRPAPAPDAVVTLDMSLSGFTAGFDSLEVK